MQKSHFLVHIGDAQFLTALNVAVRFRFFSEVRHSIYIYIYIYIYRTYYCKHTLVFSVILLQWRYSPGWALASFTICLQASRSLALSHHSFIPIFLRSVDTSSSHLMFGLPLRLVAHIFPHIIFGIAVSCILSMWPSHRIL